MELVFALLMYLGNPPVLKEHLLMPSLSECMQRKRISMRSTNNAQFQCMKVGVMSAASFDERPDDSISYWTVLKDSWKKENPERPVFEGQ